MATVSVKIVNQARLSLAFARFPGEVSKAIAETVRSSGVFLTGKVKENITSGTEMWKPPVDTGAMRRGIQPTYDAMRSIIRPASYTPYAGLVHEGTRYMRARPFFDITARRDGGEVSKFATKKLEEVLRQLF